MYAFTKTRSTKGFGDLENVLLMLYAGAIPIVPLIGFDIFRKRGDQVKQRICLALFALQIAVSAAAVYFKFFA